jgi:hypothetical protein
VLKLFTIKIPGSTIAIGLNFIALSQSLGERHKENKLIKIVREERTCLYCNNNDQGFI